MHLIHRGTRRFVRLHCLWCFEIRSARICRGIANGSETIQYFSNTLLSSGHWYALFGAGKQGQASGNKTDQWSRRCYEAWGCCQLHLNRHNGNRSHSNTVWNEIFINIKLGILMICLLWAGWKLFQLYWFWWKFDHCYVCWNVPNVVCGWPYTAGKPFEFWKSS